MSVFRVTQLVLINCFLLWNSGLRHGIAASFLIPTKLTASTRILNQDHCLSKTLLAGTKSSHDQAIGKTSNYLNNPSQGGSTATQVTSGNKPDSGNIEQTQLDEKQQERKGYRFGDLTRSFLSSRVSSLTGKEEYEFGDLSRQVGSVLSQKLANQTNNGQDDKNNLSYQFGDLTRKLASELLPSSTTVVTADGKTIEKSYEFGDLTKAIVANYTGKESYQFGDLSMAVIRRVESGEYTVGDVFLALRVLLWAGLTTFSPVVSSLPMALVVNLINFGLAQEVSGRVTVALAEWLDQRLKQALTGRSNYLIGDITKEHVEQGLAKFTGKEQYELGDITRTIQRLQSNNSNNNKLALSADVLGALDKWNGTTPKKK